MSRFDRYILSQLLVTFGVFSLVLVLVYWINRAVRLFDQIISSGESFGVFLELSALTLPNVIKLVIPVSAFAASVYVTNRLSNESELVIVQSTGYSPWRLGRPVLIFGVLVALFASVLAHVLVPASLARLSDRQTEIAENVTARLLVEGRFLHPSEGITFYISRITKEGELVDVFLSNAQSPGFRVSYTAERALLIRGETSPKLLMFDGMVQRLDMGTGRLSVTHYDQLTLDIGTLLDAPQPGQRRLAEWTTRNIMAATPEQIAAAGTTKALALFETHSRVTQSLLCVTAPLLGFAALLIGGFSRFGLWRRIFGAVALLVVLQTLNTALTDEALSRLENWPLYYFSTGAATLVVLVLFWLAAHPAALTLHKRRAAA